MYLMNQGNQQEGGHHEGNLLEDSLVEGTLLEDSLVEGTLLEDSLVEGMPQVGVGKPQVGTQVHLVPSHDHGVKKVLCQIHHACPSHLPSFRFQDPDDDDDDDD